MRLKSDNGHRKSRISLMFFFNIRNEEKKKRENTETLNNFAALCAGLICSIQQRKTNNFSPFLF